MSDLSTGDVTPAEVARPGIDRRSLIKRGAIVGAAAWTAPIIIDSLTSAAGAAACSTTPSITFKGGGVDIASPFSAFGFTFTATAGSQLLIYVATSGATNATAPVVTGAMISGSATAIATVSNFNNNNSGRFHSLFVCQGTGVAAGAAGITVSFTTVPENVMVSVYQVTGATAFTTFQNNADNSGTASITYAAAPASNAELWGVQAGDNTTTAFGYTIPAGFNWTENFDLFTAAAGGSSS